MIQQDLIFDGPQLKELGQQSVLENDESWKEIALEAIRSLAQMKAEFSSDDLRDMVDGYNIPHHPNSVGAIFSAAAKQGLIKPTGHYIKSKIPSCHSRTIKVWMKK